MVKVHHNQKPLDVWMKFDSDSDEIPTYEANTFKIDGKYQIEWSHVDVGQVSYVECSTYDEAKKWYEANGYADFTA